MDKQKNYESDSESGMRLYSYLEQLNGQPEEINVVEMDHTYSLPWHSRPDNSYAKPAKLLFVPKTPKVSWSDAVIDPTEITGPTKPIYDPAKAQLLMEETSRLVNILRADPGDPDWDMKIDKSSWTGSQNKLFDRVVKMIHMEQLSRLAHKGTWNEAVLRRISLDKAAKRFRIVMSAISWKPKLTHWLHNLLLENLEINYLIIYIDILQTLHNKLPLLVERILSGPCSPKINPDALNVLLKKPWDPAASGLTNYKPRRLPGNPLIVIVPYGSSSGRRLQRWLPYLSNIGQVVTVHTNSSNKITVVTSLEHMLAATRAKLAELRSDYGGKPIILFGLNSGSSLACQVALIEQVTAVVCLGFPVNTVEDKRGQADDNLLGLSTPTLFVIGQHSATSYVDDMEDIREKIKVETGLVIVGGADDFLRIPKSIQKAEGLTQSMLDRCIVDEVADFVGSILSAPKNPPQTMFAHSEAARNKFKVIERKRKLSVQDEVYPQRRQYVTTNRRGGGRGRGRSRYITQPTTGGIAISRRGGMTDKGITRPSIENISVINTSNIDLLGSDDFSKMETGETFPIDQLTPDRLLEMPVIIAPDNQDTVQESQIKVVMGRGAKKLQDNSSQKITLSSSRAPKNEIKPAMIYLRKRGAGTTRVAVNRQVRKPRLQQVPAVQYTTRK